MCSRFTGFATEAGIADRAEQAVVVKLLEFSFSIAPPAPSPYQHQLPPLFYPSLGDASSYFGLVFPQTIAHGSLSAAQVVGCRTSGVTQITDGGLPVD